MDEKLFIKWFKKSKISDYLPFYLDLNRFLIDLKLTWMFYLLTFLDGSNTSLTILNWSLRSYFSLCERPSLLRMLILYLKFPWFLPAPALKELSPPLIRSVDPPSLLTLNLEDLNVLFLEVCGALISSWRLISSKVDCFTPLPIPLFLDLSALFLVVSGCVLDWPIPPMFRSWRAGTLTGCLKLF